MTSALGSYPRHRFPAEIISHAVWLYHVFSLSLRDVELILAERGVGVTHESIRHWCRKFGADFARRLRRRRPRPGDTWHLDEVFIRIRGVLHYLWRAVDQQGVVPDILVQKRRNGAAAKRFFRRLLRGLKLQTEAPHHRRLAQLWRAGVVLIFALGGSAVAAELSPQDRAAVDLAEKKYDDAYNAKDAATWAGNFTADAIRVTPDGIARGRDEVRKQVEADFKAGATGLTSKTTVAVMSGNVAVVGGEWSLKIGDQSQRGYWSNNLVREGDVMKISLRLST